MTTVRCVFQLPAASLEGPDWQAAQRPAAVRPAGEGLYSFGKLPSRTTSLRNSHRDCRPENTTLGRLVLSQRAYSPNTNPRNTLRLTRKWHESKCAEHCGRSMTGTLKHVWVCGGSVTFGGSNESLRYGGRATFGGARFGLTDCSGTRVSKPEPQGKCWP